LRALTPQLSGCGGDLLPWSRHLREEHLLTYLLINETVNNQKLWKMTNIATTKTNKTLSAKKRTILLPTSLLKN